MNRETINDFIFFKDHYGLIHISCRLCDFEETILCKYSGFNKEKNNTIIQLGFQCKLCGKYTRRIYYPGKTVIDNFNCDCGGLLERNEPMFCTKCQSLHLNFISVIRIP